jgi:hypothetical protein
MGQAVVATCSEYGVQAAPSLVNDVTIGRRKVYGSAQVEFYSAFVHSGTGEPGRPDRPRPGDRASASPPFRTRTGAG